MEEIYVFATLSGDLGRWAYYLNGEIKYGESKGTTKDQMYLMGILQILRNDDVGDEIQIHISDERTYKRLIGEYKQKSGIITDYLNEIGWATGKKVVKYMYVSESDLIHLPFYIAVQRVFQGRAGLYFDLEGKDAVEFEVQDPFNGNTLKGYLCRIADARYGMLYIEFVNGEYCPQWIWATPKIRYPFDKSGVYKNYDIDRIEVYEKKDGSNILCYIYEDAIGNKYVTYKTRLTPIVKDMVFGPFESLWREVLEKYPMIPQFCLDNDINASFELYGRRNQIPNGIRYEISLETAFLFTRSSDGLVHPPSEYNVDSYGFKSTELWKVLDGNSDFVKNYETNVIELNDKLKITKIEDGSDILEGIEGTIWYAIKDDNIILLKCKPDHIRDMHMLAASGIPKHSIYITCYNIFESKDNPTIGDVIELLKEEFTDEMIQKKYVTIERIFHDVFEQAVLKKGVIDEYERNPEFNIIKDKRSVMRHFSLKYPKSLMQRVYGILINEFGEL